MLEDDARVYNWIINNQLKECGSHMDF